MATDKKTTESMIYQEVCESYHRVDDLRTKLLGLLPLATAGGIFLLLKEAAPAPTSAVAAKYLVPIGIFGVLVTFGLFSYELQGIKRCRALITVGKQLENSLGFDGQFRSLSSPYVAGFIGAPWAACVIYSAVLAAWVYLALVATPSLQSWVTAPLVFILSLVVSYALVEWENRKMEKSKVGDNIREP